MKTGVIDVGGGFRDIYGSGVLDWCLDHDVRFDYCIGVSAGGANLVSYMAGQRGRNYRFYTEFAFRKEYASMENLAAKHSFVDLDYAYSTLSDTDGECPLDYEAFARNPAEFMVVCCDAQTGEPVYFDRTHIALNQYDVLKGTASLPMAGPPYLVEGIECFDGGIVDPVPVQRAFDDGCDRVVLILTRPADYRREQKNDLLGVRLLKKTYPHAAERVAQRYRVYNESLDLAMRYQEEGKLLIVAPDDICGLGTLTRNREKLERMYQKGMCDAQAIGTFLAGA